MKYYLFLIIVVFHFIANGQSPSYFHLGQVELENTEVYTILQTNAQELFVGTNEGLFFYRHGKMQSVKHADNQRDLSLFGLTANRDNEIFCHNLNGQILKLVENRLIVYFEIPKRYLGGKVTLAFDAKDDLVIACKGLIIYDGKDYEEIYAPDKIETVSISKTENNLLVLNTQGFEGNYILKNRALVKFEELEQDPFSALVSEFYFIDGLYISSARLSILLKNADQNKVIQNEYKYCQISKNELWRRGNSGGIEVIEFYNGKPTIQKTYYPGIYFSHITKGENGSIILGTFGEGLIVIPNPNTFNHPLEGLEHSLRGISSNEEGDIFLADRTNGILLYDGKTKIFDGDLNLPYKLFNSSFNASRINSNFPSLFYNKNIIPGAIKDIYPINQDNLLIASSKGMWKLGKESILDSENWKKYKNYSDTYLYKKIKGRTLSVIYHSKTNSIYVSTISNLLKINHKGKIKKLKLDRKAIIANDLLIHKDQIWCATQQDGILVFQNDSLVDQYQTRNGLISNSVNKFSINNNKLIVQHKKGLQLLDFSTDKWQTLGTSEGVVGGSIVDFTFSRDQIWYISNKRLFSVPITNNTSLPKYKFDIDSILISNIKLDSNVHHYFKHNQNNLKVYTGFNGLLSEKEISIKYKLTDIDNEWKEFNIFSPYIEYNNLPPGEYNFTIQSSYRGSKNFSYSFRFTISKALWNNWWFIFCAIGLVILLIVSYFNWRIVKIKRRNTEFLEKQALNANLVETELKALRSQMNPHFIFNSLNSIQDLILQEDKESSYDYIVLFSKLVRNALHYSNQNFITLSKEIEFLKTYLKLEKLRFEDDFEYSIDSKIPRDLSIPSFIVQPFVENAIVHGLFHKMGSKKLNISFELVKQKMRCTITDNGIGRIASVEIKKRQGSQHDSFALDSIKKRFEILQKNYGNEIGYTIVDLHANSKLAGTKVEIYMPYLS